ncbi:hypothetical protein E8E14_008685 [Neopestalotiopsis sp. 37M]|nr:hypothetical protein E8E14_008685 [Neopestalotiopsis sp. 37M]
MKSTTALSAAMVLLATRPTMAQDDNSDYLNSVCSPDAPEGGFPSGDIPPCIDIVNIEDACQPNGTSSLALEAHAQCMCGGSYFAEWLGCRQCLFDHGGMSERNLTYYQSVIAGASSLLCDGAATPTAAFQTLFGSAAAAVPIPTTGGTALSDIASGDSAVSVYYTATGSQQGPGAITGSAAEATATGDVTTDAAGGATATMGTAATKTTSKASSSSKTASGGTASSSGASSSSSSSSFAGPTAAPAAVAKNVLLVMAGGALMAAL